MKYLPLLLCAILLITGCTPNQNNKNTQPKSDITDAEKDFNNSGRAKAITDESDLWQVYEDKQAKFSLKFPGNVNLVKSFATGSLYLNTASQKIDTLHDTMGFNQQTALKNIKSLQAGEYGVTVDWPLADSIKVTSVGDKNAQDFMVLTRFEVCDVTFERVLYFFNNDHQVVLSLFGADQDIINSMPEYFKIDQANCGDKKIWDFNKQADFYKKLKNGQGSVSAQEWYDTFNKIIKTITLQESTATTSKTMDEKSPTTQSLLEGKWTSLDDKNSVVEFKGSTKTDYYSDKKMSEGSYGLYNELPTTKDAQENKYGQYIVVSDKNGETYQYKITEMTDKVLTLMYLPRGNTLKYKK